MKHKKARTGIMIVQDNQITYAQFHGDIDNPTLQSYELFPLSPTAIINGIIFDPIAISTFMKNTAPIPLSLCLFSSEIHEHISNQASTPHAGQNKKQEKINPVNIYTEKVPESKTEKELWYHAGIPYHIIMQYIICAAKANRTIYAITGPLQALLALFCSQKNGKNNSSITPQTTHMMLLDTLQQHQPQEHPMLLYARGIAHLGSHL